MTHERVRSVGADLIYLDGRFQRGHVLGVGPDGRITRSEKGQQAELRLDGAAILPGFVNAHSHAFQRAIRGRTACRGGPQDDDFWSWRVAMYAAANALDDDALYVACHHAFREMAAAGYTSVGEFHYLHRDPDGHAYADPNHLAKLVARAAGDAGLRIVLLDTLYERADFEAEDLAPEQRRFGTEGGVIGFLAGVERLAEEWGAGANGMSVGIAAHSVRAVTPESLRALARWNARARRPLHIHLSEQQKEVEDCLLAYACRPIEHAAGHGVLGPTSTAIHGTHLESGEIDLLAETGAHLCVCPTTEADLGDGLVAASELTRAGVPLCLGSDSHVRIDPFEEMRRLEGHERLRLERRSVLAPAGSGRSLGAALIDAATRNGAASLGLGTGELRPGAWADFVAVDLTHPILDGWELETLPDLLALAADPRVLRGVWVGGRTLWRR